MLGLKVWGGKGWGSTQSRGVRGKGVHVLLTIIMLWMFRGYTGVVP